MNLPLRFYSGPLTRQVLFGLPEGVFLVSGVGTAEPGKPALAEGLPPSDQRASFWAKLRELNLCDRRFWVFANSVDGQSFLAALATPQPKSLIGKETSAAAPVCAASTGVLASPKNAVSLAS